MKVGKKLLSVLLAIIMIMSSMSVCFGSISFTVSAANNTDALNAFVTAIKVPEMQNLEISGPSKNGNDWTYTIKVNSYAQYEAVANVLTKLDAAVKGLDEYTNGSTHNNGGKCTDGWVNDTPYVTDTSKKNKCTDSLYLLKYLKYHLGDSVLADISAYSSEALFEAVFNMHDYNSQAYRGSDGTTDDNNGPQASNAFPSWIRNTVVVETSDVKAKMLEYSSIDAIPVDLNVKTVYKMSNVQGLYEYTESCKTKQTYHFAINTKDSNCVIGVSTTTSATNKAKLAEYWNNYNSTYSAYINAADAVYILENVTANVDTLNAALNGINDIKTNVENEFNTAIYNKFFKASFDTTTKKIQEAINFFAYETLADEIKRLYAIDFSRMNEEEILAHLTAFREAWQAFEDCAPNLQDLIAETYDLEPAAIRERIQEISDRYDALRLQRAIADVQANLDLYKHLDIDYVDKGNEEGGDVKAAMKSEVFAALAVIYTDKQYIDSFPDYLINDVFGADLKAALDNRYDELSYLGEAAEINVNVFAQYMTFVNEVTPATAEELGNEAVLEGLKNYDAWSKALKDYLASADAALTKEDAETIYDNLNSIMLDYLDAAYTALNTRVESQINYAWDLYTTFKAAYGVGSGTNVNFKNVSHYNHIKQSVGRIDVPAYEFLCESQYLRISQESIDKYNTLVNFELPDYQAFIDSFGFSEYSQTTIPEFTREETSDDIAREGDYTVTDANIENVIKDLDALLNNAEIQKLLGQLINKDKETGEWTGESFDLGAMLTDLIKGALFTDNMINTIVGMLYPLVVTEFIKVWANDLPADNAGYPINYKKNLYNVFTDSGFNVYPDLLAKSLKSVNSTKYADIITVLNAATNNFKNANGGNYYTLKWSDADGKNVADKTPWDEAVLKKNVIDEETGEPVLNEDGTNVTEWALDWGVDAKREELEAGAITQAQFDDYFYQTFDDAVDGLKPLLLALLGNKAWKPVEVDELGTTKQKVIFEINITIGLQLGATANRGYANLIIPVYEALGITGFKSASDLEKLASNSNPAADILKGILDPIFNFANTTLKNQPITTILNLLPNLAYALITDMVPELLDMLKTSITYKAVPYALGFDVSAFADISGGADISVGSMLNLKDMGVDLSDGLNTLLPGFGLNLPNIDQGALATMGKLTQISTGRAQAIYTGADSGKAYHIEANKADVLLFLIDYALGSDLLSTFGLEIPEEGFVGELFAKLSTADTREDILAAVVELLNQKSYDTLENYNWYNGYVENVQVGTLTGTPAAEIYMNPGNDWTEEKADYLYENLDEIVAAVLAMAKVDLDDTTEEVDGSLGGMIGGLLDGALNGKTLTSIARLLGSLSDINSLLAPKADEEAAEGEGEDAPEASEPETVAEGEEGENGAATPDAPAAAAPAIEIDINALIKEFLGIDLSVFAKYAEIPTAEENPEYVYEEFADVDSIDEFVTALTGMIAPISPVLDFILEGKNLEVKLSDSQKVNLVGYNGYDNAIVPILEALGCDVKALGNDDDALALTLAALVGKINALVEGKTIKGIIDILPGLFYFLAGNGLSTAVRNLLQPVYVILDTIRPIYDLDLAELLAGIEIGGEPLNLDLNTLNLNFVFDLVKKLLPAEIDLGTLLDDVKQLIYDVCKMIGVEYKSVSTLAGQTTWKKGAYSDAFSAADMITVVLSFVLEWATEEANAKKLDALLKTDGIIESLNKVFADIEISYGTPNWMYWFETEEEFNSYVEGETALPNTLTALTYPNDWTEGAANYFAENISYLVDTVIALIAGDNADAAKSVSALLNGLIADYISADTINMLLDMLKDVLANVDDKLLGAGYLLDVNLVGLKNYTCEKKITTISEFVAELAFILDTYAPTIVNLLFFGDDIRLAKKSDKTDTIVINGGLGYEKGLALILEALGCDVPAAADATTANVLGALATRVEAILGDPVNEILDMLPNLVYFLNANGAGVAVDNMLQPVYAIIEKINALGILKEDLDLAALLGFDLKYLSLADILDLVEDKTGLDLEVVEELLVDFCLGKITKGQYIYKMTADRKDTITVILTTALLLVSDEDFAAKLDEMLGTDGIVAKIKDVFTGNAATYVAPDWDYCFEGGIETEAGVIELINNICAYPNDWTEEKAAYLAENLPALVDTVVAMVSDYETLTEVLTDNVNIFTTETLKSLVDLITGLLGDIEDGLLEAGMIIDVDLVGLKAYKVPEGIATADAFAAELANVLNSYAKGAVEWLLLGRDFKLFVDELKVTDTEIPAIIYLNGAQGYAEGLALLLEALGCKDLPAAYNTEATTEEIVTGVLASLANRINEIFANPVEEVINLLPNLIYFLDADGVEAVIKNTAAAVLALVERLDVFGIELDLESLVDIKGLMGLAETDATISIYNLTITSLLEAVSLMTDLDLSKLEEVIVPFALGNAVKYDSVSSNEAYKMELADEYDKHDLITVIVTAALRVVFATEGNVEQLGEMIGTDIIGAIETVIAPEVIEYTAPVWDYALADNGTVDAMKYAIEYPNNWNEETAAYVTAILPELGDLIAGLIDGNYETLSDLLKDKVNVFTTANLQAIVDLIANLLADIDDGLLDAAGVLLGADVVRLKAYKAPEGITTADAFAAELANVLNTYAKGVVEWLLLGNDYKFFVKEVKDGAPVDFININGANGYAEGLALLLEALGCENLPAADGKTEDIVTGVLASLAALINKVLEKPVETVVELLPNLFYFLNTNGAAAVVNNTLAAVTALLEKLSVFGIDVDIKALVDLKALMGLEDTDAAISLDNLSMAAVLEAVGLMVGLDLTLIKDVLVGFALGQVIEYDSVSANAAYKMTYKDEFDKHDMLTVLVNLVVLTIADANNAEFVKGLLGEEAYAVVENLCIKGVVPAAVQEFDWKFTDKADTGEAFSALATSSKPYEHGSFFTKEMADYIGDNFGEFVDNIVYLLGIEIIEGKPANSLSDLINDLLGGSLYNSSNVVAIRDALAGALSGLTGLEVNGKNVGKYIVEVLKKTDVAKLDEIAKVAVPEFSDNKAMFVEYLCAVLEPIYPVLKYVLAEEDFAFFVNTEKEDLVKLQGAAGYAYGIIPLLETLDCKDILAPKAYYAAVEADGAALLTAILNPLLNRVDEIIANPGDEILDMLPNIIYFINSNGLDTVVKNTLAAVYGLLNAIEPIAKIDLYELIGIDLATIDFNWILDKLLEALAKTGYVFSFEDIDAVAELTVGMLESYESLNGLTAYRMVYAEGESGDKGEMATVIMRLLITFITDEKNKDMLIEFLVNEFNMSNDAKTYVEGLLEAIIAVPTQTRIGMDQALAVLYYVFFGIDTGVDGVVGGVKDVNAAWQKALGKISSSNPALGILFADFLDKYMEDVLTSDGVAPNGLLAFFAKISDWFNKIIEFFKNLFA